MIDFEKTYTTEDLRAITFVEYKLLEARVKSFIKEKLSEKEKEIIIKAREISNAPYHFAANISFYIMGEEKEAELKEIENKYFIKEANEIICKIIDLMPINMYRTFQNMNAMRNDYGK